MSLDVFVLGGHQSDFARNWAKEGKGLTDMVTDTVAPTLEDAGLGAEQIDTVHVGNLAGELFAGQAQLGGIAVAADPGLEGKPSARHEAACASGSIAVSAAVAEIAAGLRRTALVIGVEQMRNVSASQAAANLGSAAWVGREAQDADFVWPALFARIASAYDERHGLDMDALGRFAQIAFENAKDNPLAQTRDWDLQPVDFTDDPQANPLVEGMLRKNDCGRITDGAAGVVLASREIAQEWARSRGMSLDDVPRITGLGHTSSTLLLEDKLAQAPPDGVMFPHLRSAVQTALGSAGVQGIDDVDVAEVHDCFTISGLLAVEHLGLAAPGSGARAILDGETMRGGRLPINPGGGLMAAGHPVGATGVRMLLDAAHQVSGAAGAQQIYGARTALTVNIGGSFTTVVSFVVQAGA